MKTVKRYEIRVYKTSSEYSKSTNHKLYERSRAMKIVKFLKKRRKVDAIAAPMSVII